MSELICNLPAQKVYVRKEYLRDLINSIKKKKIKIFLFLPLKIHPFTG
jgi:hypothetical protein